MGGENTYTQILLKYPPQGVEYIHFKDALEKGEIEYTAWQSRLSILMKLRILPLGAGFICLKLKRKYDLIHSHAYSLKLDGKIKPPVILSDSSSNSLFLKDYLGWPNWRIKINYFIRGLISRIFGIYDQELNIKHAQKLLVFSKFAKDVHQKLGADPKKIEVIYPGIPKTRFKQKKTKKRNINILFAGVWFERKGGLILLQAFNKLIKLYTNLRLTILGPVPSYLDISNPLITHQDYVDYKTLLTRYYPQADIFVLVPPKAEGFGLVVLEAQSFGIPTIVSSVYALSELVEDQKTGFVIKPNNTSQLYKTLEILITRSDIRRKMGKEARKRFLKLFEVNIARERLKAVYLKVLRLN